MQDDQYHKNIKLALDIIGDQSIMYNVLHERVEWHWPTSMKVLLTEVEGLKAALQEIADYPLSDYGGVIARKALGIEE